MIIIIIVIIDTSIVLVPFITIFILNVSTECPAIFPLVDREESSKEEILGVAAIKVE